MGTILTYNERLRILHQYNSNYEPDEDEVDMRFEESYIWRESSLVLMAYNSGSFPLNISESVSFDRPWHGLMYTRPYPVVDRNAREMFLFKKFSHVLTCPDCEILSCCGGLTKHYSCRFCSMFKHHRFCPMVQMLRRMSGSALHHLNVWVRHYLNRASVAEEDEDFEHIDIEHMEHKLSDDLHEPDMFDDIVLTLKLSNILRYNLYRVNDKWTCKFSRVNIGRNCHFCINTECTRFANCLIRNHFLTENRKHEYEPPQPMYATCIHSRNHSQNHSHHHLI
jgi:hypothetical protein